MAKPITILYVAPPDPPKKRRNRKPRPRKPPKPLTPMQQRKQRLNARLPDEDVTPVQRCGHCHLMGHDAAKCDLKQRDRERSFVGCVLADAV